MKSLSSTIVNQKGSALIPAAALAHIDLAADEDLDDKEQKLGVDSACRADPYSGRLSPNVQSLWAPKFQQKTIPVVMTLAMR